MTSTRTRRKGLKERGERRRRRKAEGVGVVVRVATWGGDDADGVDCGNGASSRRSLRRWYAHVLRAVEPMSRYQSRRTDSTKLASTNVTKQKAFVDQTNEPAGQTEKFRK